MARVKMTVAYDGSEFSGWQRQKNAISVQECVENALEKLFHEKITIYSSGRTDEGVHAIAQVCHFDVDSKIPLDKISFAIKPYLPTSIAVISTEEVDENFNARYGAKQKTYLYKIYVSPFEIPYERKYKLCINFVPDISLMQKGASYLVGEHDFKAFSATGSKVSTTVRKIYDISITKEENQIFIRVTGNGFLYNMVRIIVGTLLEIGRGKYPPERVQKALETRDRTLAGKTVSGKGLYLEKVIYNS